MSRSRMLAAGANRRCGPCGPCQHPGQRPTQKFQEHRTPCPACCRRGRLDRGRRLRTSARLRQSTRHLAWWPGSRSRGEVERHGISDSPPRSPQPQAVPLLPAWAMELHRAADIGPYLVTPHGCLPPDVIGKLQEAMAKGMGDHLAEVARKLSALRGLGLDDDQIRDQVIAARDYVFVGWSEKRVDKGKLTEEEADCAGASSMPPGAFARGLAVALAKRVEWVKRDVASGKFTRGPQPHSEEPRARSTSDKELAALLANPMWSVGRTIATNADLVDLCEEFPTVRPNRVRQHLIDAYAELATSTSDVVPLSDLLDCTRENIRSELEKQGGSSQEGSGSPAGLRKADNDADLPDDNSDCPSGPAQRRSVNT